MRIFDEAVSVVIFNVKVSKFHHTVLPAVLK